MVEENQSGKLSLLSSLILLLQIWKAVLERIKVCVQPECLCFYLQALLDLLWQHLIFSLLSRLFWKRKSVKLILTMAIWWHWIHMGKYTQLYSGNKMRFQVYPAGETTGFFQIHGSYTPSISMSSWVVKEQRCKWRTQGLTMGLKATYKSPTWLQLSNRFFPFWIKWKDCSSLKTTGYPLSDQEMLNALI